MAMISISSLVMLTPTLMSAVCLLSQREHLLMALLALEAMVLSITLLISALSFITAETFFCVIVLTFGACEASLGLALLVLMLRSTGSDMVKTLTINKC